MYFLKVEVFLDYLKDIVFGYFMSVLIGIFSWVFQCEICGFDIGVEGCMQISYCFVRM